METKMNQISVRYSCYEGFETYNPLVAKTHILMNHTSNGEPLYMCICGITLSWNNKDLHLKVTRHNEQKSYRKQNDYIYVKESKEVQIR